MESGGNIKILDEAPDGLDFSKARRLVRRGAEHVLNIRI